MLLKQIGSETMQQGTLRKVPNNHKIIAIDMFGMNQI